tara:strand:+ start:1090 stop:1473 length:384 start_codon:yes stop_codon:yes gene_type:complete
MLMGCQSNNQSKLSSDDTKLYKTWSNVYLVEMGNAIVNHDFDTYAFYMSEYEQALSEETERKLQFLEEGENVSRYGDTEHEYYIQTTMKMAELNYSGAYFYFQRYLDVLKNRFFYNLDYKPIPKYAL